jgi:hypothetical protein
MSTVLETLDRWCAAEGIPFINEEAEKGYKDRAKRMSDAIQLKVPDRVPIVPSFGMFPAIDNGYTCEEVMFDYEKAENAWMKTLTDFEPDMFRGSGYAFSGPTLEILDYKLLKLPGRRAPVETVYQFDEWEFLSAEEFYDPFLDDPTHFHAANLSTPGEWRTCSPEGAPASPPGVWLLLGYHHQCDSLCHARVRQDVGDLAESRG